MELTDFYLDKTIIFSLISQEKIFEKYLFKPDLSKKYTNPFRVDKNPDCTFYYKNDKLYFVDNAWNKKHYDCFNIVITRFSLGYNAALRKIYNEIDKEVDSKAFTDLKIIDKKSSENILRVITRNFLPEELLFWSTFDYQSTQQELQEFGIHATTTIFEQDFVVDGNINCFTFVDNAKLTQIYKPYNKGTYKRRFINVKGLTLSGFQYLKESNHLVITKSKRDTYWLSRMGVNCLYLVTESITLSDEMIKDFNVKYEYLFILADRDFAGFRCTIRHKWKGLNY